MKNEAWWLQTDDEDNTNLRSMLLYLIEIIKAKQTDSYESACNYLVDIFRYLKSNSDYIYFCNLLIY
jgi:hypothetical protein